MPVLPAEAVGKASPATAGATAKWEGVTMPDLIGLWVAILILGLLLCWFLRGARGPAKPPDLSAEARWRAARKAREEVNGQRNYPPDW